MENFKIVQDMFEIIFISLKHCCLYYYCLQINVNQLIK